MKLYSGKLSSSSRRVRLTAAHLGTALEEIEMDLRRPEVRAQLGALNPNHKIPVLDDGDLRLWESHAIMQYLCERVPEQTLYPRPLRARIEVERWLFWVSSHLAPAVGGLGYERMWKKFITGGGPDPAMVEYHEGHFHRFAKVADDHLATRSWLAADHVTLADLSVAATLMYEHILPLAPYRNLRALLDRVHALPAWQATQPPAEVSRP